MGIFNFTPKCAICGKRLDEITRSGNSVVWDGIECQKCHLAMCMSCALKTAEQRKGRCPRCQGETKGCSQGL